jgi:hypothetical protein
MDGFHIAFQIDSTHWLVIFIHPSGVVQTVMDSHDFMDFIADEANTK